jgi:hypothetical protein
MNIKKIRHVIPLRAFARASLVVVYKVIVTALAALGDQSCTTKRLDGRTRSQYMKHVRSQLMSKNFEHSHK